MKFYNRERELSKLEEIVVESNIKANFVVLSGRRRVGKTTLIKHFAEKRNDVFYLFVSKKKPHLLLAEFTDLLAERIPILSSVVIKDFDSFFKIIFEEMTKQSLFIVIDEFQNFQQVDDSLFSVLQKLWDSYNEKCKGAIICIGSVQTLMRDIFEGNKEPLFGRATAKIPLKPLTVDVIGEILADNSVDVAKNLLFFHSVFGGIPKYYAQLDRSSLFCKSHKEIIRKLFCEVDAILQNEGRELLIEEFGKNYHLYFSILQTVACGATQMSQIADKTGIGVNSISKYLDELVSYYEVLERRSPATVSKGDHKNGRYYIADPLLRFWFRYIHKNQSLVAIGKDTLLSEKICADLPTFMGLTFEKMTRDVLIARNDGNIVPFVFEQIGGYWDKNGRVEIDIVAMDDTKGQILFGECKLNGNQFSVSDVNKLKEKASQVKWGSTDRKEHYALFSNEPLNSKTKKMLAKEGVIAADISEIYPEGKLDSAEFT